MPGPTVEVDFPAILYVCYESRTAALRHVFIQKVVDNYRLEDWKDETWNRISQKWSKKGTAYFGMTGYPYVVPQELWSDSDDMESMSEWSEWSSYFGEDPSTLDIDEDDRSDTWEDNGPNEDFHDSIGLIGKSTGEDSLLGDHGSESDLEDHLAAAQPAEEMPDRGSDSSDANSEDTSESDIPVTRCYVARRPFRPELDYMFVDNDDLEDFQDNIWNNKPWLPQHLALWFDAYTSGWLQHEGYFAEALEECLHLKSISVVYPSGGGRHDYQDKHWRPRLKVNIPEVPTDLTFYMRCMLVLDLRSTCQNGKWSLWSASIIAT